jgi:hypothetical protein
MADLCFSSFAYIYCFILNFWELSFVVVKLQQGVVLFIVCILFCTFLRIADIWCLAVFNWLVQLFLCWVRAHQGNWQPQRNPNLRELLSAGVEYMSLNGAAQIEETADKNSQKLRLHCGFQFPWWALTLRVMDVKYEYIIINYHHHLTSTNENACFCNWNTIPAISSPVAILALYRTSTDGKLVIINFFY